MMTWNPAPQQKIVKIDISFHFEKKSPFQKGFLHVHGGRASPGEFALILRMQPPGTDEKINAMEDESKTLLKETQKD